MRGLGAGIGVARVVGVVIAGTMLVAGGIGVGMGTILALSALLVEVELVELVVDLNGSFFQIFKSLDAAGVNQPLANGVLETTTEILHEGGLQEVEDGGKFAETGGVGDAGTSLFKLLYAAEGGSNGIAVTEVLLEG